MPVRDTAPIGAPCWIDLMTADPERSRAFYGELFGWTAGEPAEEYGGYFMFTKDGHPVAGGMDKGAAQVSTGMPDAWWTVYMATDDIDKTITAAAQAGTVVVPAMRVGDLGAFAVLADSDGAGVGIWEPGTHHGFGIIAQAGAPGWFELHTRNYEAALDFYRDVFGWDIHVMSDTPEFRYATLGQDDDAAAGIMDASGMLPDGVPAHWSVYFGVDDTDATLTKANALGGSTVMPAEDTPFGRLAVAADPLGAQFKLVGPNVG